MAANLQRRKLAPISTAQRAQLRRDLDDLRGTAARKGTTLDRWEEVNETNAGNKHFELGCWLYYYNRRIGTEGLATRVDCARRIFQAGFTHLGYEFFTAFDFGERQFDTLFEMGDGKDVIAELRKLIPKDTTGNLVKAFAYMGWPIDEEGGLL